MIDSASLSVMDARNAATRTTIDVAVARKSLDSMKIQGAAVLKMLQSAAMPPSPEGVGTQVDAYA